MAKKSIVKKKSVSKKVVKNKKERLLVVIDRGFIHVGHVIIKGNFYSIPAGYTVRRWGTTKGLGELAMNGPLAETELDQNTEVMIHKDKVIFTMKCNEEKWKSYDEVN